MSDAGGWRDTCRTRFCHSAFCASHTACAAAFGSIPSLTSRADGARTVSARRWSASLPPDACCPAASFLHVLVPPRERPDRSTPGSKLEPACLGPWLAVDPGGGVPCAGAGASPEHATGGSPCGCPAAALCAASGFAGVPAAVLPAPDAEFALSARTNRSRHASCTQLAGARSAVMRSLNSLHTPAALVSGAAASRCLWTVHATAAWASTAMAGAGGHTCRRGRCPQRAGRCAGSGAGRTPRPAGGPAAAMSLDTPHSRSEAAVHASRRDLCLPPPAQPCCLSPRSCRHARHSTAGTGARPGQRRACPPESSPWGRAPGCRPR